MVREGYIERIIFRNDETAYTVLSVETTEGEEVFVGSFGSVYEGLFLSAEGEYVSHPQYDLQFKVTSYDISMPADAAGIERYLGSGLVKGIGKVLAKRIVKKFGEDTLRIIAEEPERLSEVKGISMQKAKDIAVHYQENHEFQEVIIYLSKFGINANLAMKIYQVYGKDVYAVLRENPYRLAEDVPGVGFRRADEIAATMGISPDSVFRLQSALMFMLSQAEGMGHVYLPEDELLTGTYRMMMIDEEWDSFAEKAHDRLIELSMSRKVMLKNVCADISTGMREHVAVYPWWNYVNEAECARRLLELCIHYELPEDELEEAINVVEKTLSISLDPVQKQAVRSAICSGVAVITGGPGTGKTTIINAIIHYFENNSMEVELAAPTGRAAKRIRESTGAPARTIHRLLEFNGEPDPENKRKSYFARNEEHPLECDAVIIDEASMIDAGLMHSLLMAVPAGTRLILVGDTDQLPSVGAGNVLHDIIASRCFPVTTLSTIFRQSEKSEIVSNAHRIKNGEHLEFHNRSSDFFYIPRNGPEAVIREICELLTRNLPQYLGVATEDIQVLTPMRKYELGVEALNRRLQEALNPPAATKREKTYGDVIFREGDKIMQIRNNYKLEWRIPPMEDNHFIQEEGVGVFNGDMGHIVTINSFDEKMEIRFDDGREASYPFSMLEELEHAFAVTVHKSQGSEYPAVVMPLYAGTDKLLTRNLFYTAVTRARTMVVLVGNLSMVNRMIDNESEQKRYTGLRLRLEELYGMEEES